MTRGERLRDLFERACGLPAEERNAFLERECDGDSALRSELEALVFADGRAEHRDATAALVEPVRAAAVAAAGNPNPTLPDRIGPYRVIERLGEGGMGVVYRAEQTDPIRREVALKLTRGGLDSSSVVARFEVERQALALMDHPAIARVYDAGTAADGSPYFAMEYVRGRPITAYCVENSLPTRARLSLFLEVCAGVQHAHHKGVIHRDLKPSNILVTENGDATPKIIDFGIAKAMGESLTDQSLTTRAGTMVGTLEYMSPEQARGRSEDVDQRSDVYSLGVVLFELLAGALPHETADLSLTEAVRKICEVRPRRLGTLDRRFRGDLETIVLKALEHDRGRRYLSPGALAEDIERYLAGRPILARPPSVAYQTRKLILRHKVRSALVAALLLVVTASFVMNVASRKRAEREAAIASSVSDLLSSMFHSADPIESDPDLTVRQLIDEFDERTLDKLEGLPEIEYRVRTWVGSAYGRLGAFDRAYLQKVRLEQLLIEIGGPGNPALADLWVAMAWDLHEMARYDDALGYFKKAMTAFDRPGRGDTEGYARAQVGVADTLTHLGEYDAARIHAGEALHTFTEGEQEHYQTGMLLVIMSTIEKAVGDLEAAEDYARRAIEFEESGKSGGYGTGFLANRQLAEILLARDDCAAAEQLLKDLLVSFEEFYPQGHASVLLIRSLLGESLICQGRYQEAEAVLRDIDPGSPGFEFLDDHERYDALDRLSRAYEALGRVEQAASYHRLAEEFSRHTPQPLPGS